MGWTILLIILLILGILLLLPVRVKGYFADGKWGVSVYYAFIRLFHKESAEKEPPVTPPKPDDIAEGGTPTAEQMPEPEPAPPSDHAAQEPEKPPAAADAAPKPDTVTETPEPAEAEPEAFSELPADPADDLTAQEAKRKKRRRKKKPAADPPAEPDAAAAEEPEKPKKKRGIRAFIHRVIPHSLSDVLGLVRDGFASLSPALRFLAKHLHFRHIKLYAAVGTDDAAKTAKLYGTITASAYNLIGQLQCLFDFQADECRILADFFNDKITFRASGELRVSPLAAILLALILGGKFLIRTVKRFRREDKEAKLREKETAPLSAEA